MTEPRGDSAENADVASQRNAMFLLGVGMLMFGGLFLCAGLTGHQGRLIGASAVMGIVGVFTVVRNRSQFAWVKVPLGICWLALTLGLALSLTAISSFVVGYRAISYWPVGTGAGTHRLLLGLALLAVAGVAWVTHRIVARLHR